MKPKFYGKLKLSIAIAAMLGYIDSSDAFYIASQLHLRIKNSIECLEDLREKYPLTHCNAIYALRKGQPTIYYDEKYPYKNFAIAHEIAHYLRGHTSDGVEQHQEAQLMAAIIVAPSEYIHGIKSAMELAEKCKIPIDAAENYWYELEEAGEIEVDNELNTDNIHQFSVSKMLQNSLVSASIIAILLTIIGFMGFHQASSNHDIDSSPSPTPTISNINITPSPHPDISNLNTVYVTPTGKRYHRQNCRHIQSSEHIFEMTYNEAMEAGYEPCKDCID